MLNALLGSNIFKDASSPEQVSFNNQLLPKSDLEDILTNEQENLNLVSLNDERDEMFDHANDFTGSLAGWGFSNDIQNLLTYEKKPCFKGNVTVDKDIFMQKSFDRGISNHNLEAAIGYNHSDNKVDWGVFSNQVYADYLRAADDQSKPNQVSWHYYVYGGHWSNFSVGNETGKDALTFEGKIQYLEDKHKLFGINCGDNYISSFLTGQMMLFGVSVQAESAYDKQILDGILMNYAHSNLTDSVEYMMKNAVEQGLHGTLSVIASQYGGTYNLTDIYGDNFNGYQAYQNCNITNSTDMASCMEVARELQQYATLNFTNELMIKPDQNLTNPYPLGLSFAKWVSIDKIGLDVPPTTITPLVRAARNTLTQKYFESQYYLGWAIGAQRNETMKRAYSGSPGLIDNDFAKKMKSMESKANYNLMVLKGAGKDIKAVDCWIEPDATCQAVVYDLNLQFQNYTEELKSLRCFKYHYNVTLPTSDSLTDFTYWTKGSCNDGLTGNQYCLGNDTCTFKWARSSPPDDDKTSDMNLSVIRYKNKYWDLDMTSKEERDGFPDYTGIAKCTAIKDAPVPTDCDKQHSVKDILNMLYFDSYEPDNFIFEDENDQNTLNFLQ